MRIRSAMVLVLLAVCPAARAQGTVQEALADVARTAEKSLAMVEVQFEDETGEQRLVGVAVCIDASGVFMTHSMDERAAVETIQSIKLFPPGSSKEATPARLLGIDAATNLTFVKAERPGSWQAVQFSRRADLSVGQPVVSAGLMIGRGSRPVNVGLAYVSCSVRAPEQFDLVTGGRLTRIGSPVFTLDGRAVGLVGRQLFLEYRMMTPQGQARTPLAPQQQTCFFTPVDEFAYVLERIPSDGKVRRLPWLGIGKFEQVRPEYAEILGLDRPGIMIEQILPGHPGDKAGLEERDVILAMNGQPVEDLGTPEFTTGAFLRRIARMEIGQTVTLSVLRDTETQTVRVTLAPTPELPSEAQRYYVRQIGLLVREKVALDRFLEKGAAAQDEGLLVVNVARGSPAEQAQLQSDDLITQVNGQAATTVDKFRRVVEDALVADPTAPLNFQVRRGTQTLQLGVAPVAR